MVSSASDGDKSTGYAVPSEFAAFDKQTLKNSKGILFKDFRKNLKPKYWVVWRDIFLAYAVLFFVGIGLWIFQTVSLPISTFLVLLGALVFGYTIAFIQLFFHEAAHFNIAKNRLLNDLLTDIFIGGMVGQDVRKYRLIHWGHHKWHGTPMDSEQTYFDPLNSKFIVESLLGIKVLNVLSKRQSRLDSEKVYPFGFISIHFILGIIANLLLLLFLLNAGKWQLGLAWLLGMTVVFPFFASLRQVLEHRDEEADSRVNYHEIAHGMINRIFGDGLIADTLGGAGFNRHLLHHWDPQCSYTRLKTLESYLMDTPVNSALQKRRTTYWKTFLRLYST
jgi:fatty acid desaturase